ncbi:hypothetical protein BDW69DRAFT_126713 [Aspergillus filifer]
MSIVFKAHVSTDVGQSFKSRTREPLVSLKTFFLLLTWRGKTRVRVGLCAVLSGFVVVCIVQLVLSDKISVTVELLGLDRNILHFMLG